MVNEEPCGGELMPGGRNTEAESIGYALEVVKFG